jgi:6-phosphogluconolactonase (cycloisomerase 2 family)
MTNDSAPASALWSGSYTADSNGHGDGIGALSVNDDGTITRTGTAVIADSPSFIAVSQTAPVVYAALETAQEVRAYAVTGASTLEPLGDAWPAGPAVCHVTVDPLGRYLIATCWGDGTVHAYELDAAGAIVAAHATAPATDPYAHLAGGVTTASNAAPRQSRAHASIVLPDGRILSTDLGFDLARIWRFEPGSGLVADHEVTLHAGSGPRHPVLHSVTSDTGGVVSIVTEYSVEVVTLARDSDGRYAVTDVTGVFNRQAADGDAGAHISVDESGEHLHVTVRGSNRVAVLAVRDGGIRAEPVADVDCGGDCPRHHLQRGQFLYVTNQLSDNITVFELDAAGIPSRLVQTEPAGSPTCLIHRR